ncbi:MAG: hypothetical protein DRN27_08495, partial [Thermoplasmata archaeon]
VKILDDLITLGGFSHSLESLGLFTNKVDDRHLIFIGIIPVKFVGGDRPPPTEFELDFFDSFAIETMIYLDYREIDIRSLVW